jgi:hypothetical protein
MRSSWRISEGPDGADPIATYSRSNTILLRSASTSVAGLAARISAGSVMFLSFSARSAASIALACAIDRGGVSSASSMRARNGEPSTSLSASRSTTAISHHGAPDAAEPLRLAPYPGEGKGGEDGDEGREAQRPPKHAVNGEHSPRRQQ